MYTHTQKSYILAYSLLKPSTNDYIQSVPEGMDKTSGECSLC